MTDGPENKEENALLSAYLEKLGVSQDNPAPQDEHSASSSTNDLKALLKNGVNNAEGYYQNLKDYIAL